MWSLLKFMNECPSHVGASSECQSKPPLSEHLPPIKSFQLTSIERTLGRRWLSGHSHLLETSLVYCYKFYSSIYRLYWTITTHIYEILSRWKFIQIQIHVHPMQVFIYSFSIALNRNDTWATIIIRRQAPSGVLYTRTQEH